MRESLLASRRTPWGGPVVNGGNCLGIRSRPGRYDTIQTADLGHRVQDGFEVLGREPGAEARGCSIAADELLAGAGA